MAAPRRSVAAALALAVAVAAVIALVAVARSTGGSSQLRSTPSVVVAVRDVARLESVEYHVERVTVTSRAP